MKNKVPTLEKLKKSKIPNRSAVSEAIRQTKNAPKSNPGYMHKGNKKGY